MAVALSEYVGDVRALLGERFGGRTDADIIAVLRLVIRTGKVPGYGLGPDRQSVTPDLDGPTPYIRLIYHTVLLIAYPDVASNSWRLRAGGQSYGSADAFLAYVEDELALTDGSLIAGNVMQDLGDFLRGCNGLETLSERLTRMTVGGPWNHVHLSPGGVSASPL